MKPRITRITRILLDEIRAKGPIPFQRFMEVCLYHPECGYYTSGQARFDYYTSSQLGPMFARLMARRFRAMRDELEAAEFTVLEMAPGHGEFGRELQAAAPELKYLAVGYGDPFPETAFTGCVFSNEFFDALPVQAFRNEKEVLVGEEKGRLVWFGGPPAREFSPDAALWVQRFAGILELGYIVTVDYGYRGRERERFPEGTVMSYYRHVASEDVLADPGERDITAHVDFDQLVRAGEEAGLREVCFETQGRYLMRLGQAALEAEAGQMLALKNLLFGIGETMRVLEMRK